MDVLSQVNIVSSLEVARETFQTWQEAVEREETLHLPSLGELETSPVVVSFNHTARLETEALREREWGRWPAF